MEERKPRWVFKLSVDLFLTKWQSLGGAAIGELTFDFIMHYLTFVFVALVLMVGGCRKEPTTLVRSGYDQQEMDNAIARARRETDEFLKVLSARDGEAFSVKAPITDANGTEHFWLTDVTFENGVFKGAIGNDPGIVKNVQAGQSWSIPRSEISDWMYTRSGRIYGGYTIDPLLGSWDKKEADALRAKLVR